MRKFLYGGGWMIGNFAAIAGLAFTIGPLWLRIACWIWLSLALSFAGLVSLIFLLHDPT